MGALIMLAIILLSVNFVQGRIQQSNLNVIRNLNLAAYRLCRGAKAEEIKKTNGTGNEMMVDDQIYFAEETKCTTPDKKDGKCVVVSECPPLYALINKANRSPQDIDLLRKSHCGYQNTTPKVCCDIGPPPADKCFTADGQVGECVGLYNCPRVMQMLSQQPVPQETLQFVQNSRCTGKESYSVCCTQDSVSVTPVTPSKDCKSTIAPPDPRTECCGRDGLSGNRITGGNVTAIDQYPWLTLIEYQKDNKIKLLCGGVLISGRYVLTAGHCVLGDVLNYGTPKNIRLGEYDTTKDNDCMETEGGGTDCSDDIVIIPIELTIPHPEYLPRSGLRRHDIALIRMASLAPYTDFIRPICLPETDVTTSPPPEFRLFAAGWGAVNETVSASKIKLDVDLPYKTLQECQKAYNIPRRSIALWNRQLCAGGEKGKDSCKGDSGGPLMYENGRVFEVVGIVSFGTTPCGLEDVPGVYTKVFEYRSWIKTTMRP